MNHPCDGQTDRRTDGIAIAYARLAYMLSRAKMEGEFNNLSKLSCVQAQRPSYVLSVETSVVQNRRLSFRPAQLLCLVLLTFTISRRVIDSELQKVTPKCFLPVSQQLLGILTWNFISLLLIYNHVKLPSGVTSSLTMAKSLIFFDHVISGVHRIFAGRKTYHFCTVTPKKTVV